MANLNRITIKKKSTAKLEQRAHDVNTISNLNTTQAILKLKTNLEILSGLLTDMPHTLESFIQCRAKTERGIRQIFTNYLKSHPTRQGRDVQERTFSRIILQITALKNQINGTE